MGAHLTRTLAAVVALTVSLRVAVPGFRARPVAGAGGAAGVPVEAEGARLAVAALEAVLAYAVARARVALTRHGAGAGAVTLLGKKIGKLNNTID